MKESLPPYDLDAEESVLGSLLIDTESMLIAENIVGSEDFFSEQNQIVFSAMKAISDRGEAIDQVTVARQIIDTNNIDNIGGVAYLSHLVSVVPTSLHIAHYARIVVNLSIRRRLISFAEQVEYQGYKEPDINISFEKISKQFLKIQKGISAPQLLTPTDIANIAMKHYSEAHTGKRVSISCGIEEMDEICGGMFPGECWLLGAATGLGKTSLIVNTIADKLSGFFKVLYVGLEMFPMQIVDRQIAGYTKQPLATIRRGNYSESLEKQIYDGVANISTKHLYFYSLGTDVNPQRITTDSIFSVASYMKMAYGLDLVIVDYLSLLDDRFGDNSNERVGYISRKLKLTASALGVPFWIVCQLNRELFNRQDKRPQLTDLRDSGKLEQDADVVCFLHRNSFFSGDKDDNSAELIFRKIRQGDEQNVFVNMEWNNITKRYV